MDRNLNHEGVDRLLNNAMPDDIPPEAEQRLGACVATYRERLETEGLNSTVERAVSRSVRRVLYSGAIAAALAVVLIAAWLIGFRESSVYADILEALERVQTVHAVGWMLDERGRFSSGDAGLRDRRHPVELWLWTTKQDEVRSRETEGPITVWDDGQCRYEYNRERNHTQVSKSKSRKFAESLPRIGGFVRAMKAAKRSDLKITSLPERPLGGRTARGMRIESENQRREVWLDVQTDLPLELLEFHRKAGEWVQTDSRSLSYDEKVPEKIASDRPTMAGSIDYEPEVDPALDQWRLHLERVATRYENHPLPKRMELLPRELAISQTSPVVSLPGYDDWRVQSVKRSLLGYLRRKQITMKLTGRIRVAPELHDVQLNYDIVFRRRIPEAEMVPFVLKSLGFQLTEIEEQRRVWVARHDGRRLKPWQEVMAPVPRPDPQTPIWPGMARGSSGSGVPLKSLFRNLMFEQDPNMTARELLVIDETGLTHQQAKAVAAEMPSWEGPDSPGIAKAWFEDEFGITFVEETRPIKTYVVRKQSPPWVDGG